MTTTASKLTEGARVLVTGAPGPLSLAKTADGAQVATLTRDPLKDGRKLRVETDLGDLDAGPTAKVLLAPAAEEAAPPLITEREDDDPAAPSPTPEDAVPAPAGIVTATATVNALGQLTPESVVRVGDREAPVRREAGDNAPARLAATLAEMGYEPVTRWANGWHDTVTCQVRPAHP